MRLDFSAVASLAVLAVAGVLPAPRDQAAVPGGPAQGTQRPVAAPVGQTTGRGNTAPLLGTAIIRGRVVAADTGAPLQRAEVRLNGLPLSPGDSAPLSVTDDQGRYEFRNVPAGRLTPYAGKNGYLTLSYGQRRPLEPGRPLDVTDGQTIERIDFVLPKFSVIAVRVTDDFGEPIAGVQVRAERYRFTAGQRALAPMATVETDDWGEARLSGLSPGDYYVSANAVFLGRSANLDENNSGRLYAPSYYPGTSSITEAQPVVVGIGVEASVSFALIPVRAARISGIVRSSDGSVPTRSTVRWTVNSFFTTLALQPDGSFTVANVLPGEFTLNVGPAASPDPLVPQEYARVRLKVAGEDISGLVVTTSRGATLRGRVLFDTGAPPSGLRPDSVQVFASFANPTADVSPGSPISHDDWTFEVTNVVGPVVLRLRPFAPGAPPSGWFLKAVLLEGKDVTDTPLELTGPQEIKDIQVVLTQKRSDVSGSVVDSRNTPVRDYVAVLFPEDKSQWTSQSRFIAAGRPDQQGGFRIVGLPAGRYLAAAVESLERDEERDPELLERLQAEATRLTIAEGEAKTISLRVMP